MCSVPRARCTGAPDVGGRAGRGVPSPLGGCPPDGLRLFGPGSADPGDGCGVARPRSRGVWSSPRVSAPSVGTSLDAAGGSGEASKPRADAERCTAEPGWLWMVGSAAGGGVAGSGRDGSGTVESVCSAATWSGAGGRAPKAPMSGGSRAASGGSRAADSAGSTRGESPRWAPGLGPSGSTVDNGRGGCRTSAKVNRGRGNDARETRCTVRTGLPLRRAAGSGRAADGKR